MTRLTKESTNKYNQTTIKEISDYCLVNYSKKGVSHWFQLKFNVNRKEFTKPLKASNRTYISSLVFLSIVFIAIMVGMITASFFIDSNGVSESIKMITSYAILLVIIFLVGVIVAFIKKRKFYPILNPDKEIRSSYKSNHIVSILDNIAEPGIVEGVFSVPGSMVLGYRIEENYYFDEEMYSYPGNLTLDLLLRNSTTIRIANDEVSPSLMKRLKKAVDESLRSIGLDPSREYRDEGNNWVIRGIPAEIPLQQVLNVYKTKDSSFPRVKYPGFMRKTPHFTFSFKAPCHNCSKETKPSSLIYDMNKKPPLICRSCLKKKFKSRIKEHNAKVKSLVTFAGKVNTVLILYPFLALFLLVLSFQIYQLGSWIQLLLAVSVGWLGYLVASNPDVVHNYRQVIGLETGIEPAAEDFIKDELGIDTPINKPDQKVVKAIFRFGVFTGLLMLVILFSSLLPVYLEVLTEAGALSTNSLLFLVIIQVTPALLIYTSLVLGTLSIVTEGIHLNDLNYYLPPSVRKV
ncbi:MAG: hypothetical protein ACTSP4_14565 [Candidatus Hodarchaeales archaeon]